MISAQSKGWLPKGRRPAIRAKRTSFSLLLDAEQVQTQEQLAKAHGFPTRAAYLRFRDRQDLLHLEAAEAAREATAAADQARERERMAPYAAPDGPEDEEEEEDDIEESDEEEPEEDDETPTNEEEEEEEDDDEGEDLDEAPSDVIEFTQAARAELAAIEADVEKVRPAPLPEDRLVTRLAAWQPLPEAPGVWAALLARAMLLLGQLAAPLQQEEAAALFRDGHCDDTHDLVRRVLGRCRVYLLHASLRN